MQTMQTCKNCGDRIIKKTALNGSGKTWFEHMPSKELFGLAYGGNCANPEPKEMVLNAN